MNLNITILDANTLGGDISFSMFERLGTLTVYDKTSPCEVASRIAETDVIIVNKIRLGRENLHGAKRLKLICVTATGYDNIDIDYCKKNGIAVCNVRGYSSNSVAQVTASMALSLVNNLKFFNGYVSDGSYTESGTQNKVTPVFHEMNELTWGIVGMGAIGKRTAEIAKVLGCRVISFKRTPDPDFECVSLDDVCRESDIISIHLPLTDETKQIIDSEKIALMKETAIVINVARGGVVDELALTDAIINKKIGGLGVDVYSKEPMAEDNPYQKIKDYPNVILTPHMAWGAYEARVRCMEEIAKNIQAFCEGNMRNRVDK